MSQIETEGDSVPLETRKNSKKSKKNKTNNLQNLEDGNSSLNAAGDSSRDNKLKSGLNSDEAEKGNTNDGTLAKKIKKKRKHLKVKSQEVKFSSNVETSVDSRLNEAGEFAKDNKLKSVLNEDDVDKGLGDDGSLAKVNEIESKLKVESKKVSLPSQAETFEGSCINAAGDSSKDNKLKSVLNSDEAEKGNTNDGNVSKIKKKRKHKITENESKLKVKSQEVKFSSHVETSVDSRLNEAGEFAKDNKLKAVLNEDDVDKGQGDDGSLAKKVNESESKLKVESKKVSLPSQAETFEGTCINAAGDSSKDNNLKSVLNSDEAEKGNTNDGNLSKIKKKRKRKITENESKLKGISEQVEISSHVETSVDSRLNKAGELAKDNKLKAVLNEDDVDKGQGDDGSLAKKVNESESKLKVESKKVSLPSQAETFEGSCLNTVGDSSKDNKLKSVLNSDEIEKGITNDGNLSKIKKKRKLKITGNGSKLKGISEQVKFSSHVETSVDSRLNEAGELAKDNKLESVLNEDDVEKGQGNDGSLSKKVNESESKLKVESKKVSLPSQAETFGDSCINAAGDSLKDNKLKSVLNEDKDETEKVKENNDNIAKKTNKKRKHEATENKQDSKVKAKKVSFSSHVEFFPSSDTESKKLKTEEAEEDKLVQGKRFTPEEDAIVKDAVLSFIKSRKLGDEGLSMVLNCRAYPELRSCWKTIGTCIPYRPYLAIYFRAHSLFERGERRKWTKEETDFLIESYEKHGKSWKMVAEVLGKNRVHVKDKWRRIKLKNKRAGKWSQEEYQTLYDLVNLDLQTKAVSQEKKSKHGMLRDNISWGEISEKLSTRTDNNCCVKWYNQLTSSLVQEGKWSNADDYRLVKALYDLDAACIEDVDWDCVLEHRSGDICRKRWDQMVKHIGHHGSKPFIDQVEILSQRYCPELAETREVWDSAPLTE